MHPLFEAAAKYPFLVPVEWNEVVRGTAMEEVLPLVEEDLAKKFDASDGVQPVVWFRLDDDDVLAADYLTHLENYRTLNHVGMAISFGLGLTAYKSEHELVNLREFYHRSRPGHGLRVGLRPGSEAPHDPHPRTAPRRGSGDADHFGLPGTHVFPGPPQRPGLDFERDPARTHRRVAGEAGQASGRAVRQHFRGEVAEPHR